MRSSPCCSTACRVSSPESRGVMTRNRSRSSTPSADPIPEKTNPPPRQRSLMPVAQQYNQNASVLIYVLPMYFSHALIGLAALGLPILSVVPVQRGGRVRLQVLAGTFDRDFTLAWPIWREPASLVAIRAVLSHPDMTNGATALAHLGVEQVRRARRI